MSKYSTVQIQQYLHDLAKNENISIVDVGLFNEVKELIFQKYGTDFNYINSNIVDPINRQIKQCHKYYKNISITDKQLDLLIYYLEQVLDEQKHLLHKETETIISQNAIDNCWIDDTPNAIYMISLLQNIIKHFHILNMFEKDEKELIVKERDLHKINAAIELLSTHTDNIHLLHYLQEAKSENQAISKPNILSSFFYHYIQILLHNFHFNKSKATKIANEIMNIVFDSNKDYRIYTNTTSFKYKDLTLTKYVNK